MSNDRGGIIVFVYATPQAYLAALYVESVTWTGPEQHPEIIQWATHALMLLTAPRPQVYASEDRLVVENGRGRAVALELASA